MSKDRPLSLLRQHAFTILFIIFSLFIIRNDIVYYRSVSLRATPDFFPAHTVGNADDYHQYIFLIKTGREGKLLYHNAYSEEPIPDVLLQPIYNVVGLLSRPFPVSLYTVYFIFHVVSLIILFVSIYLLISRVFNPIIPKIFATILYFTAIGFWSIVSFAPFQIKRYDLADYNFDLFSKFHVIAPHHNIAIALVILVFIVLTSTKHHAGIVAGLLSLLLGLIHPYIQLMMFLMLFANALIQTILERKLLTRAFRDFFIIIVISSPLIVYYLYLTNVILHFTVATDGILTFLPRTISFLSYLQALGPLFIFALPSLVFFIYSKPYSIIRFLLLWAFLPILLFFFPDFHLPFAVWRLSQIYQHIPLAILGAYWVYILIRNKRFALSLMILVGGITLLYGFTAYNYVFQASADTHDAGGYIFTYYVPTPVIHAFTYLDRETPRDSVVLASQMVSSMIPSFTHNRVIIGHNGNNRDYYQKLAEANMFFTGTMSYDDAHAYLLKRHVSYIIFGLDMPGFTAMSYANMGFLKLVYGNPYDISVVKVLR